METVLVVGATGNIGVSAIIGALKSNYNVLAVVRNQGSAEKLFQHVGTKKGITIVEADVTSDDGIEAVVEKARKGALPSFQHVYSCVGMMDATSPIQKIDLAAFRKVMNINMEANFLAYRATMPYLLEQGGSDATWTICTGAAGEIGCFAAASMTQGALYALAKVAAFENAKTIVRCNELFLGYRVEFDSVCQEAGHENSMKASEFARVYERVLSDKQIKGTRVSIFGPQDVEQIKYEKMPIDFASLISLYR